MHFPTKSVKILMHVKHIKHINFHEHGLSRSKTFASAFLYRLVILFLKVHKFRKLLGLI